MLSESDYIFSVLLMFFSAAGDDDFVCLAPLFLQRLACKLCVVWVSCELLGLCYWIFCFLCATIANNRVMLIKHVNKTHYFENRGTQ